jgi:hypothetical protein
VLSTTTIFEKYQTTEFLFFLVIVLRKSNHSEVWHHKSLAIGMSLLLFHGFAFFSGGLSHYGLSKFLVAHYHIIMGCS